MVQMYNVKFEAFTIFFFFFSYADKIHTDQPLETCSDPGDLKTCKFIKSQFRKFDPKVMLSLPYKSKRKQFKIWTFGTG